MDKKCVKTNENCMKANGNTVCESIKGTNEFILMSDFSQLDLSKKKLLLHSCCGPCSTAVIERLIPDYHITIFFYNPNITDGEEYEKRKATQLEFIKRYNGKIDAIDKIAFLEGNYNPEYFYELTKDLESEPEGGKRCEKCFWLRLSETAKCAKRGGFETFATTLTISPHKNYEIITLIGAELAQRYGVGYLDMDFKKKAGFQRSIELSRKYNLYRQSFCGCKYTKQEE